MLVDISSAVKNILYQSSIVNHFYTKLYNKNIG